MHAVLKPASARPKAARRPEPPAPTTTASYSWSMTGYLVLTKGEASWARKGRFANILAAAGVEENALDWLLARRDTAGVERSLLIAIVGAMVKTGSGLSEGQNEAEVRSSRQETRPASCVKRCSLGEWMMLLRERSHWAEPERRGRSQSPSAYFLGICRGNADLLSLPASLPVPCRSRAADSNVSRRNQAQVMIHRRAPTVVTTSGCTQPELQDCPSRWSLDR